MLAQARQALGSARETAAGADAAREAASREEANARDMRDALHAAETKLERLETALEELEAARAEAQEEADQARQDVAHKEGMLSFVEREVIALDCT